MKVNHKLVPSFITRQVKTRDVLRLPFNLSTFLRWTNHRVIELRFFEFLVYPCGNNGLNCVLCSSCFDAGLVVLKKIKFVVD